MSGRVQAGRAPLREYDIKLHITENIHVFTAMYTVLQMYIFIIIGSSIVPIFSSHAYFGFGAPIAIAADPLTTETITHNSVIVGIAFFLMVDRFVTLAAEEAVAHTAKAPPLMKYVMIVTYYMRYGIHIVFLRTQITFVIATVVADILGFMLFKWNSINRRLFSTDDIRSNYPMSEHWVLMLLTLIQVIEIPCFFVVYMFAGLFDAGLYFEIGPPLVVFSSSVIGSKVVYWLIILLSFFDMFLSCAVRNNIESWSSGTLQNSDKGHEELGMPVWEARLVSASRMVMYYIRVMFVYSFLTTQYFFIIVYIIADMLATVIYDYRCEERNRRLEKKRTAMKLESERQEEEGTTRDRLLHLQEMTRRRDAESDHDSTKIILLAMFQTMETILLMVVILISHWFSEKYFEWGSHIVIFDVHITSQPQIKLLMAYVAFDRISATLYNNVILPDFNNWLYTPASEYDGKNLSKVYSRWRMLAILTVMRINNWFRFVIQIQFILSNYAFVVIAAAVDVPLSMIVNERHIRYKHHKGQVDHTRDVVRRFKQSNKGD